MKEVFELNEANAMILEEQNEGQLSKRMSSIAFEIKKS
jgi:hypothetical protein